MTPNDAFISWRKQRPHLWILMPWDQHFLCLLNCWRISTIFGLVKSTKTHLKSRGHHLRANSIRTGSGLWHGHWGNYECLQWSHFSNLQFWDRSGRSRFLKKWLNNFTSWLIHFLFNFSFIFLLQILIFRVSLWSRRYFWIIIGEKKLKK